MQKLPAQAQIFLSRRLQTRALKVTGPRATPIKKFLPQRPANRSVRRRWRFQRGGTALRRFGLFRELPIPTLRQAHKLEFQLTDVDRASWSRRTSTILSGSPTMNSGKSYRSCVPLFKHCCRSRAIFPICFRRLASHSQRPAIPGRVDYLREGQDESGGPCGSTTRSKRSAYGSVTLNFPALRQSRPPCSSRSSSSQGAEYCRASLAAVAKFDLLPVYLQRGYLKAAFGRRTRA